MDTYKVLKAHKVETNALSEDKLDSGNMDDSNTHYMLELFVTRRQHTNHRFLSDVDVSIA